LSIWLNSAVMNTLKTSLIAAICALQLFSPEVSAQEEVGGQISQVTDSAPADPVARRVAEFTERTRQMMAGETDRRREVIARQTARQTELDSLQAQLTVALSMPPASAERTEQIDQTYASTRNLVDRIRDDRIQAVNAHQVAQQDRDAAHTAAAEIGINPAPSLAQAVAAFRAAHDSRVAAVQDEIDGASMNLASARSLRRQSGGYASSSARLQAKNTQLRDIKSELASIPLDVDSAVRRSLETWWKAPASVNQVQALGGLFLGLMELALLLVGSIWIHGRMLPWMRKLMDYLEPEGDGGSWDGGERFPRWIVAGDLRALSPTAARVSQDLIVGGVALSVMLWLREPVPLLSWVALVFAAGAGVRLGQGAIELALITPTETRPALRVTEQHVRDALLWFAAVFGMLLAIEISLQNLLVEVLGADQLGALFGEAIAMVGILLLFIGLYRWGSVLRSRVAAGGAEGTIAAWVVGSDTTPLYRAIGAAVGLCLLVLRVFSSFLHGLIESRAGLSWLGAALARRQLRGDSSASGPPLPLGTRNLIGKGALRGLHMDEERNQISQIYTAWKTDPRRGLIAVTGDRGSGKATLLEQLSTHLDGDAIHATTPIGHTDEASALGWLIRATEIEASPNTESVIQALLARPRSIFILSSMHRLFLRAVEHYEGLDAVLDVMQATAKRHFWVASFHGPAWTFLASMNHVGNVGIFPHRVHLGPTSPADMSAWLHAQTRAAGFKPRFDELIQRETTGPDRARMLERTERAFWRLMVEASQGNPTVAARLWVDGLRATETDRVLSVGIPRAHDSSELDGLSDNEFFTLTAIILHEDVSVSDLAVVLNLTESRVRATCRGLEQLTLITETDSGRYKVRLNWLPAVERHLRRRSFLHKG